MSLSELRQYASSILDEMVNSPTARTSRSAFKESIVDRIEKATGSSIKPGRNMFWGLPVDIDDQSPEENGGLYVTPVDADAAQELLKKLRAAGLKTKWDRPTKSIHISEDRQFVESNEAAKEFLHQISVSGDAQLKALQKYAEQAEESPATRAHSRRVVESIRDVEQRAKQLVVWVDGALGEAVTEDQGSDSFDRLYKSIEDAETKIAAAQKAFVEQLRKSPPSARDPELGKKVRTALNEVSKVLETMWRTRTELDELGLKNAKF